jgi:tetratricopeptide (TPR) repeat protein
MKQFIIVLLFPVMVFSQSAIQEVEQLFQQKKFIKAEKLMTSYVSSYPKDLKGIELLGDAYGHQKKWDEAIEQYKMLVEQESNNANFHYKLGGALGMKALSISKMKAVGIIGDVKSSFLKAAELDPKHIDARWALVELYMQLPGIIGGSKKKSLKFANELQVLSRVDGYLAKGYIFEYDDEPELAENYYRKAIKIGGSLNCYEKLTKFYETQNEPEKAIENLEDAQKNLKRNALHYQLGKVSADYNVQLDKGEQCLKLFVKNHSVEDGVPVEWAYYRLAQIYKHRNKKDLALSWIDKALDVRANFKQALKEKIRIQSL